MIPSEISIQHIVEILNSPSVLDMIHLVTMVLAGLVFLILLYHWFTFSPRNSVKLTENEHIIKIFHKHWFRLLGDIVLLSILAFLPSLSTFLPNTILDFLKNITPLLDALYQVWLIFLGMGILIIITDYVLDAWVLTNKRIVDIEQKNLFRRDIAEIRLEKPPCLP